MTKTLKKLSKRSTDTFYIAHQWYSITINPCDRYQYFGRTTRFQLFKNKWYEVFLSKWCNYDLVIELSEPRDVLEHKYQGSRLHLHGIIQFNSGHQIKHFLLHVMRELCQYGSINIDICPDMQYWYEYCNKQTLLPLSEKRLSNFINPDELYEL